MKTFSGILRTGAMLSTLAFAASAALAESGPAAGPNSATVVSIEGKLEYALAGTTNWLVATTNLTLHVGDRVRTHENSRALIRLYPRGEMRLGASALQTIEAPKQEGGRPVLELLKGFFYFFNREKAIEVDLHNRLASATTRGTEFVVRVGEDDRMEVVVMEGEVDLRNDAGTVTIRANERGLAVPGQPPTRTAEIEAKNLIQWCLYYPAVLDVNELGLTEPENQMLGESLAAYRKGDLLGALRLYPQDRQPQLEAERVYRAALLLSVGEVEQSQRLLEGLPADSALARALRQMTAAVQLRPIEGKGAPALATEWMAESYYRQSQASRDPRMLHQALEAAHSAAAKSPDFGFAWARVADLEFSFGNTRAALEALDKALALSPNNAQAMALKGFLLASQNRTRQAIDWFNRAIAADSALANAWLGRGLCKIRLDTVVFSFSKNSGAGPQSALEDLLTAAALEPQRSLLRSYLGKALADAGDDTRAMRELDRARDLDNKDPTSWLYSALLKQQQNRINEAISDLEESQERNDNRSLFRSRLKLDEDTAVRSANLASIYRDAGMTEVSLREAARAVTYDYANDSAHLFLSDSYNEFRDPTRFNLRYETVWFNELLLANLLSPIGGGRLSQHVSQQEYSRLFDSDRIGLANSTLARSDGVLTELASQFGTIGGTSYALDLDYQSNYGVRQNNDLQSAEWYSTVKQQITPQDTFLALIKYEDYHSGDNFQYYDPEKQLRPNFRFDEYQHPISVFGWHHEWSPGMHTLLLGGRLINEQFFTDKAAPQLVVFQFPNGTPYLASSTGLDIRYHNQLEIYTAELNQLFQWERVGLSLGARYQIGTFEAQATMDNPVNSPFLFNGTPTDTSATADFERATGYGYVTVEPVDHLWLTGGLAYDAMSYPDNFRYPPFSSSSSDQAHRSQFGPKAALVWAPCAAATVRGAFTRSLGGVSLDESYRLEPSQLAGFPQTFRTLMSESVVGSVEAPSYQTYGLALDLKLTSRTYAGVQFDLLESNVRRQIGLYELQNGALPVQPDSTLERLDYHEKALTFSLNQLLGDGFVLGASYKFADVRLKDQLPLLNGVINIEDVTPHSDLHQITGYVLYNHPSGWFARADATWYHQHNSGYPASGPTAAGPGDDFVQENLYAGYRFFHRRGEIMLGLLNLSGQDYHLAPLTVYTELPRKLVFEVRLNFQF